MSTLAAARADNFYFPPEWDPKKGSMNKQQGQHPLRERAKKIDQGILVIRYATDISECSIYACYLGEQIRNRSALQVDIKAAPAGLKCHSMYGVTGVAT